MYQPDEEVSHVFVARDDQRRCIAQAVWGHSRKRRPLFAGHVANCAINLAELYLIINRTRRVMFITSSIKSGEKLGDSSNFYTPFPYQIPVWVTPSEFGNTKKSGWRDYQRWKNFRDIFSRFVAIPQRGRRADRQNYCNNRSFCAASRAVARQTKCNRNKDVFVLQILTCSKTFNAVFIK